MDLVSTRKKVLGTYPGITTAQVMGKLYRETEKEEEELNSIFHLPKRQPSMEQERKVVLAQVLRISILDVLNNHTCQWAGAVRKQEASRLTNWS